MPTVPASPSVGVPLFLPIHFLASPARHGVPGSPALVPSQGIQHPFTPPSNLFAPSPSSHVYTPYGFLRTPGTAVPRTARTLLQVPITPFPGTLTKGTEQRVPSQTPAPASSAPRSASQSTAVQIDDLFQENIFEDSSQPAQHPSMATLNGPVSSTNAASAPASAARELDLFEDDA